MYLVKVLLAHCKHCQSCNLLGCNTRQKLSTIAVWLPGFPRWLMSRLNRDIERAVLLIKYFVFPVIAVKVGISLSWSEWRELLKNLLVLKQIVWHDSRPLRGTQTWAFATHTSVTHGVCLLKMDFFISRAIYINSKAQSVQHIWTISLWLQLGYEIQKAKNLIICFCRTKTTSCSDQNVTYGLFAFSPFLEYVQVVLSYSRHLVLECDLETDQEIFIRNWFF